MTLTVEQLITALDAKSIHYTITGHSDRYHMITFNCPFSSRHEVVFEVVGEFMSQSIATFVSRDNKHYNIISNGTKYKAKLLEFLTN